MAIDPMRVWEYRFPGETWARDDCGATIYKAAHGQRGSQYGWEVDHIIPESRRGSSNLENLRPLHWENNDAKGNRLDGHWYCARTG